MRVTETHLCRSFCRHHLRSSANSHFFVPRSQTWTLLNSDVLPSQVFSPPTSWFFFQVRHVNWLVHRPKKSTHWWLFKLADSAWIGPTEVLSWVDDIIFFPKYVGSTIIGRVKSVIILVIGTNLLKSPKYTYNYCAAQYPNLIFAHTRHCAHLT